jgi:hypothetical protein
MAPSFMTMGLDCPLLQKEGQSRPNPLLIRSFPMRKPSITVNKSSFLGRGQIIPPNNCPPFGRKLIGSHENPEAEDPMYVRWEEKRYKEEDTPSPEEKQREQIVENWQVPCHPKYAIIRTRYWRGEMPARPLPQLEPVRSRPISNVFLAVVFALAVCCQRS